MRAARSAVATLGVAVVLMLSACTAAPPPQAKVVVRVAPSAHPEAYEVHLAQAEGAFRSVHRIRSGQTRTFTVPTGWLTVRVAGVCVVPAKNAGTTTVDVGPSDCTVV